jgi:hypothetical protein
MTMTHRDLHALLAGYDLPPTYQATIADDSGPDPEGAPAILAHYDTPNGCVPCRVIRYGNNFDSVTIQITASKNGYRKGETILTLPEKVLERRARTINGALRVVPIDHDKARFLLAQS